MSKKDKLAELNFKVRAYEQEILEFQQAFELRHELIRVAKNTMGATQEVKDIWQNAIEDFTQRCIEDRKRLIEQEIDLFTMDVRDGSREIVGNEDSESVQVAEDTVFETSFREC